MNHDATIRWEDYYPGFMLPIELEAPYALTLFSIEEINRFLALAEQEINKSNDTKLISR